MADANLTIPTDPHLAKFTPKEIKVLTTDRQLGVLRFSPCGKFLFAGSLDNLVRRWDATVPEFPELPPLAGHNGFVQALAFGGEVPALITGDSWGELRAWPYAEAAPQPAWKVPAAHDGWIRQIAVSPDRKLLATCGIDKTVRLWLAADGQKQQELAGHAHDVYSVAFHPDGKSLVSGDLKGVVKHWDLSTGKPVRELDAGVFYHYDRIQDIGGVRCLAFDAKGETLICGGSKPLTGGFVEGTPVVILFDFASGAPRETVEVGQKQDGFVFDMHVHADGFIMAVTSGQPGKGQLLYRRPGEPAPFFVLAMQNCHSLSLHPDGRRLAVCSTSGGSNGNGRVVNEKGEYVGSWSPVHLFEFPQPG